MVGYLAATAALAAPVAPLLEPNSRVVSVLSFGEWRRQRGGEEGVPTLVTHGPWTRRGKKTHDLLSQVIGLKEGAGDRT